MIVHMEYGLDATDVEHIKEVFAANPCVQQVILFGSRAIGNYKPGSDIDLALEGASLTFNDLLSLNDELDKLGTLYTFDLQNINSIKDTSVLDHIRRVGRVLYP